MNEFALTFWGNFKEKITEQSYLQKIAKDVNAHNRVGALAAGIGYWTVTFADFAKLGFSHEFYICASLRLLYLVLCLAVFFILRKSSSLKTIHNLSFAVTLGNSLLIVSVIYFLNSDRMVDTIDQITVPVVTLLFYIFMHIPLVMLFINGLLVTFMYLIMLVFFMQTTPDNTINILAILIVINFMGIYLNRFLNISRRKDYANKTTIENLNDNLKLEIEERKGIQHNLEYALQQITDSINYARKIQLALLPSAAMLHQHFRDSAIFFRPKNIVSGDFYWMYKIENKILVAVADCTGHGIPGGFMSVLGISLLNDIIKSTLQLQQKIEAADILNKLRTLVIQSLQQAGQESERRDGMDIALIIVDKDTHELQFAGAYNPLWLIRSENNQAKMIEFQGDKMPIGMHTLRTNPFTLQQTTFADGDILYLFTDGIKDQFGGTEGKKLLSKPLKDLLLSVYDQPLNEQIRSVTNSFDSWKGKYTQVDDVLMLAIKL